MGFGITGASNGTEIISGLKDQNEQFEQFELLQLYFLTSLDCVIAELLSKSGL